LIEVLYLILKTNTSEMGTTLSKNTLQTSYPLCYKEYTKLSDNSFLSLISAIESLLFKFKIGVVIIPIHHQKSEVLLGHASHIKIYPQCPFNLEETEITIIQDFKKFKSFSKTQKVSFLSALDFLEDKLHFYPDKK
jgi:hypothetical protein